MPPSYPPRTPQLITPRRCTRSIDHSHVIQHEDRRVHGNKDCDVSRLWDWATVTAAQNSNSTINNSRIRLPIALEELNKSPQEGDLASPTGFEPVLPP
jgi:hypothetical protein